MDLRAEVESLLRHDARPQSIFDTRTWACGQELVFGREINPGECLGPYEILFRIGEGGMGRVYRALDTRLQRTVAIKVLASDSRIDSASRRRFMTEARMASALNHPNIVTLHDIGEQNGVDFLVLEYVPGETLERRSRKAGCPSRMWSRSAYRLRTHLRPLIPRELCISNTQTGTSRRKQSPLPTSWMRRRRWPTAWP